MTTEPWPWLASINGNKKDLMVDDIAEKQYPAWVINRGLSYYPDTVMQSNFVNMHHHLDNRMAYDYLINSIRPRKRNEKWGQKNKSADLALICEYYGCDRRKGLTALSILTLDQIEAIKKKNNKGGVK